MEDQATRKESPTTDFSTSGSVSDNMAGASEQPAAPKQPSKIKQLWTKIGLDKGTVLMMLKGSLPPTIAIAMYQSTAVATEYSTLGYLVAITSILGFAIMPRGKFIQVGSTIAILLPIPSCQSRS